MIAYCDQGDLELAVGGARELRQLADPNKTGSAQAAIVEDYLETGAAEIRAAAEVKHEPEALSVLDADTLRKFRDVNAALSARTAYTKGARGMAMPDWVEKAAQRADEYLEMLATGRRRLGRAAGGKTAALGQPVGVVDHDPLGQGISVAAFKKGFR